LANKQYISIIRLLKYCEIPTDVAFDLPRTKKQLQAEFNIAQGGFIETDGYTYTRQDVFEEIDRPDFLSRLHFHKQLWNSPQILQMLEKNKADLELLSGEFKPFWSNPQFDEFFSPYFAAPFNYISRTLLADMQFEMMGELLAFDGFLLPSEREEAFSPLRTFLDDSVKLLRNISKDNYKMMRPKMAHWIDTDWHGFLNALPDELYDVKVQIVNRLINIGVAVQKTHRRDCRKMSGQLILLSDMPENLRSVIFSNHKIYSRSRFSLQLRSGFWAVWLIIAIVRAISSESCNNSSNGLNGFDQTKFTIDSSVLKALRDSSKYFQKSDTAHLPRYP